MFEAVAESLLHKFPKLSRWTVLLLLCVLCLGFGIGMEAIPQWGTWMDWVSIYIIPIGRDLRRDLVVLRHEEGCAAGRSRYEEQVLVCGRSLSLCACGADLVSGGAVYESGILAFRQAAILRKISGAAVQFAAA